jgi:heptosyltransferase II
MVLAQSLFRLLKQRHPYSQIDVLAPSWTEPLLARMPEVDESIPAAFAHGRLGLAERLRLGRGLRARGYDWAILLPRTFKSALVPWIARIPRRTGYRGEWRYGLLNDIRLLDKNKLTRTVDRYVALGLDRDEPLPAEIPAPRLLANLGQARAALERLQVKHSDKPILALAPGAEYGSAKRWPEEYYADLAHAKLKAGWQVWLFGSSKDAETTREIQRLTRNACVDLAGRTSLSEAVDLLSLAHAVVTNDSGLMHIAAALGRPLVAVYGSSDPTYTPPLGTHAQIVYLGLSCSPCFQRECPLGHLRCLYDVEPTRVLSELEKVTAIA